MEYSNDASETWKIENKLLTEHKNKNRQTNILRDISDSSSISDHFNQYWTKYWTKY